jgi:hypothetical protein
MSTVVMNRSSQAGGNQKESQGKFFEGRRLSVERHGATGEDVPLS